MITLPSDFKKDIANKKIFIRRSFQASLLLVWNAWTVSNLLDQWWAPRPWKAETTLMDFRTGGSWLYDMVGPDGTRHRCRADYDLVVPQKQFTGTDAFCDENWNIDPALPVMHWQVEFSEAGGATDILIILTFQSIQDLEKIMEMGFQEGFSSAHGNLDELLASAKFA